MKPCDVLCAPKRIAGRTMLVGAALASVFLGACASRQASSERDSSLQHVRDQRQQSAEDGPSEALMPAAIRLERREGPLFR